MDDIERLERRRNNSRRQGRQRRDRMKKVPPGKRKILIFYPGCDTPDRMSKSEFDRWKPCDFPPGTRFVET